MKVCLSIPDSTIKTAASVSIAQDSTVISENISTARDDSAYSIKESSRLQTASANSSPEELHKKMMNDKSNLKNHNRSGSESSVMEEIQSQSSESKKYEICSNPERGTNNVKIFVI